MEKAEITEKDAGYNIEEEKFLEIIRKSKNISTKKEILDLLHEYDNFLLNYEHSLSARINRTDVLEQLGLYHLALNDINYVLEKRPDLALAWCSKSFILNVLGNLKEGFEAYEWRWKTDIAYPKEENFPIPRWRGEEIGDKKLIIYAEQGIGDNIQFVRFAIEAHVRGFNIIVVNHKSIEEFLGENLKKYGITVGYNGDKIDGIYRYTSMMSLPFLFGTTLDTIPFSKKYLEVNDYYKKKWEILLGTKKKKRIGIVWAGSKDHKRDKFRSISFEKISELFKLDFEFHCLQKEISFEDIKKSKQYNNLHIWNDKIENFSDTAGLIEQLDLVISVDTSIAHLSGALGKKTWIMITYHPDYRWLLNREDSPWYQEVKLFRQNSDMEWKPVIDNVKENLKKL